MKRLIATLGFLSAFVSASAQANELVCNTGNGVYVLIYSSTSKLNSIELTVVNASGVEDAQGLLSCVGPEEAAYGCSGEIPSLAGNGTFTGPLREFELTVGAATFQIGRGSILVGATTVSCESK